MFNSIPMCIHNGILLLEVTLVSGILGTRIANHVDQLYGIGSYHSYRLLP